MHVAAGGTAATAVQSAAATSASTGLTAPERAMTTRAEHARARAFAASAAASGTGCPLAATRSEIWGCAVAAVGVRARGTTDTSETEVVEVIAAAAPAAAGGDKQPRRQRVAPTIVDAARAHIRGAPATTATGPRARASRPSALGRGAAGCAAVKAAGQLLYRAGRVRTAKAADQDVQRDTGRHE